MLRENNSKSYGYQMERKIQRKEELTWTALMLTYMYM